jgi:LCP family protein required for cell wall assembly
MVYNKYYIIIFIFCWREKSMKNNNKFIKINKIMVITLLSVAVLSSITIGGSYLYIKSKLSNIKTVDIPKDPSKLGISPIIITDKTEVNPNKSETSPPTKAVVSSKITNILILGKDSRNPDFEKGHSDTVMILTIDEKHNKLKLTSIMRDSYVKMDGHLSQKLTNSHAFGGALLTLKTVNQNFNMDITDYIEVNLFEFPNIIDYVGGISVNVTADEVPWANYYIKEIAGFNGVKPSLITNPGLQTLNGSQVVGYSRIRYVGNSDFQRTSRQRTVLTTLYDKLIHKNITDIPGVIDTLSNYVETSLQPDAIMGLAKYILINRITTIEQSRVPYDNLYHDEIINGAAVLVWDKQPTIDKLHQFIFESK